jgi:uncharacterized membrane protein YbhN (UPF0104 family)
MAGIMKQDVNYNIILLSLLFGLGANIVRSFRWANLIDSLGKKVNRTNVILAILGNYAINTAIPFRVGDIWRCGVTAKYEKVPFTKLLGTLFVDRIMDTIMVTLISFCIFIFNINFLTHFFSENPPLIINYIYSIVTSVWTYVGLIVTGLLLCLIFVKYKHLSIVKKIRVSLSNFLEGIKSLQKIKNKFLFVIQTFLIWGGYFLYLYVAFFAFDFTKDLGVRIGLMTFVMGSISIAVPVQGGIGVWHFMVISTLTAFGVSKLDAGAFAFLIFAVQALWVIITGLIGIIALPIYNASRHKINDEVAERHDPTILDTFNS